MHSPPPHFQELCLLDFMHIVHLGILRDYGASMAISMLESLELAGTGDRALKQLWVEFRAYCHRRHRKAPSGSLSLRLLNRTKRIEYPEMSTSAYKAITVKWFCQFISERAIGQANDDEYSRVRGTCAWCVCEFLHIVDTAGSFFSEDEWDRYEYACRGFMFAYARLAKLSAEAGVHLWRLRPKLHMFDHLLDQTREARANPKTAACFGEESFLGFLKRIAIKCHGASMLRTSLLRYMLYLALRWQKCRLTGQPVPGD